MKLTLVEVSRPNKYPQVFRRIFHTGNLVLPYLAALTPPDVSVTLINEAVHLKKPDYRKIDADLVAFSVRTSCANRAYAVSDVLRSRGIKTVMGGIHPTVLPEEARLHCDAVVIGEAEPVWEDVLADFREGKLKPLYRSESQPELKGIPLPRRDLLKYPNRAFVDFPTIQTGRGCPHRCAYCSVTNVYGGKLRKRPVEDIIGELKAMEESKPFYLKPVKALQDRVLIFLDDNLFADRRYAKEFLARLKPFKKRWYTQASILAAGDAELLRLAADAGCRMISIGLESVVEESLNQVHKKINRPASYKEAIGRIHDAGIMVAGSFIVGFDGDDESVFEKTVRGAVDSGVDTASFHILTPYPGTPFFNQVRDEGRFLDPLGDWRNFDTQHVVFQPKRMKAETLQAGFNSLWREFTSFRSMCRRAAMTPKPHYFWPLNIFHGGIIKSPLVSLKGLGRLSPGGTPPSMIRS